MFTQFTFLLTDSDFSLTLIESPAAVPSGFNHYILPGPCQQLVCDWGGAMDWCRRNISESPLLLCCS